MNEISKKDVGLVKAGHVISIVLFSFATWAAFCILLIFTVFVPLMTLSFNQMPQMAPFPFELKPLLDTVPIILVFAIISIAAVLLLATTLAFSKKNRAKKIGVYSLITCILTLIMMVVGVFMTFQLSQVFRVIPDFPGGFDFTSYMNNIMIISLIPALLGILVYLQLPIRIFANRQVIPAKVIRIGVIVYYGITVLIAVAAPFIMMSSMFGTGLYGDIQRGMFAMLNTMLPSLFFSMIIAAAIPFLLYFSADNESVFYQYFIQNHPSVLKKMYAEQKKLALEEKKQQQQLAEPTDSTQS